MMSFDWKKYLELAEYLNNNSSSLPDEEAGYRASVSRAYYAAFCTTRGYVRESEGEDFNDDAHRKLREYLKKIRDQHKIKITRKIANQLEELHVFRKMADYDDDISREKPRNMAFKAITMSKKIISEINQLSTK